MSKAKNISVEVIETKFRSRLSTVKPGFRAEVHRDDGSWSYGYAWTKEDAIAEANRRLDDGDELHVESDISD